MNTLAQESETRLAAEAQPAWALTPIRERLKIIRKLRHRIAENAEALAASSAAVSSRPVAEKLASEVLPLADACRWLEKNAERVLATRFHGKRGRPFWLSGATFEVQRQAFGVVLVIGPGNYPLFLPAIHALQALVAGNAVLLKPAPGTRDVAFALTRLANDAGLDTALLTILPEAIDSAHEAIGEGVGKVIFTGSSENGHRVLAALAETATPSVMELSGEDVVLVLADADLDLVTRALRFGARLNAGETCMAPRSVIAVGAIADELRSRLGAAEFPIEKVPHESEAIEKINTARFALGASIFSRDFGKAQAIAAQLKTGFVLINDLIVPTADPRMPFGGTRASGFGSTRGAEGLLEMTYPHVVATRRGRFHPHFEEAAPGDAALFASYLRAAHGSKRLTAIPSFLRTLFREAKARRAKS